MNTLLTLVECALQGVTELDIGSQLFLLEQLVIDVLERLGLGMVGKALYAVCGLLKGVSVIVDGIPLVGRLLKPLTHLIDCKGLKLRKIIVCLNPISLSLPSALNLGKCLDTTLETCEKGVAVSDDLLKQLFDTLGCVVGSVDLSSATGVVASILCTVLNIVEKALGVVGNSLKPLLDQVAGVIGAQC